MSNIRFGSYVFVGSDENKNLYFKDYRHGQELAPDNLLPDFFLELGSIKEDLSYNATIIGETEEVSSIVTSKVEETINGFFRRAIKTQISNIKDSSIKTTYPKNGLAYIDKPIFYHYESTDTENKNRGGMTFAILYSEEIKSFIVGVSFCSKKDVYFKKIGNEIAWNNLKNHAIIISTTNIEEKFLGNRLKFRGALGLKSTISDPIAFIRSINTGLLIDVISESSEGLLDVDENVLRKICRLNYFPRGNRY
jgi:hypothetical protein